MTLPAQQKVPLALYRVQGFSVALDHRPEGVFAMIVEIPGVTSMAATRYEALNLIREQLAPLWKPSALDSSEPNKNGQPGSPDWPLK